MKESVRANIYKQNIIQTTTLSYTLLSHHNNQIKLRITCIILTPATITNVKYLYDLTTNCIRSVIVYLYMDRIVKYFICRERMDVMTNGTWYRAIFGSLETNLDSSGGHENLNVVLHDAKYIKYVNFKIKKILHN